MLVLREKKVLFSKTVQGALVQIALFREIATRTENVKASLSAAKIIASPSNRDSINLKQ